MKKAVHVSCVWKPVVGYEGHYDVSSSGGVRSLKWRKVRPLVPKLRGQRRCMYLCVELWKGGVGRVFSVHALVLEAFVGPRPPGYHACHNDGVTTNNSVSNLRWDSPSNNMRDRTKHGTHYIPDNAGEKHPLARLSDWQVREIRQRYEAGETQKTIAARFGIGRQYVSRLILGLNRVELGDRNDD